jgi:hypothetical protein
MMLAHVVFLVQFRNQNGDLNEQEFTLGWTVISPEVHPNGQDVVDMKITNKF